MPDRAHPIVHRTRLRPRVPSGRTAAAVVLLAITGLIAAGCADDADLTNTSSTIPSATTDAKGQTAATDTLRPLDGLTYGKAQATKEFEVAVGALGLDTDGFVRKEIVRDGTPVATVNVIHLTGPDPSAAGRLAAAFGFSAGAATETRTVAGVPVTAYVGPNGSGLGLVWAVDDQTLVLLNGADATTTTTTAEALINANAAADAGG